MLKIKILFLFVLCTLCFFSKNLFAKHSNILQVIEFEKIHYSLTWNLLRVGEANLELKGFKNVHGTKARYASLSVVTNDFLSSMFSLNANFESLFEHNAKYSFEFISKIFQDGKERYEHVIFDPQRQSYRLNSSGVINKGETLKDAKDILTALFCIRTLDLKLGYKYILNLHSQNISTPITVKVLRKEQIDTIFGQRNCFMVEPLIYQNSTFGLDGRIFIWITADVKKLPVYIKVESNIGVISAKLTSFSNKK
ncbi:MAG: DUF3108 domain-containing protein [Endomicrobium sp.]|jgi:hypothetical protein|nr:DUF3108 domain-containing protein [Endomicrobium sp.]